MKDGNEDIDISAKTKFPTGEKKSFTLEDKDFLLIKAIENLTGAINLLRMAK